VADFFPLRSGKRRATKGRFPALIYFFVNKVGTERKNKGHGVNNGAAAVEKGDEERAIQALADRVMTQINELFAAGHIYPNAVQQQMLTSHVRAMALRSLTGEPLPEVEAELFEDISPESMALARQVVDLFGNLPQEEAWLLSVHFEVAKENER